MIPYSELYDFDRLENAAKKLGKLNTEQEEEVLINLHNHLVWSTYQYGIDKDADEIIHTVIDDVLCKNTASIEELPIELRNVMEERYGNQGKT